MKKVKIAVIAALIAICAAAFAGCGGNGSPRAAMNAYVAGMNNGDLNKMAAACYPQKSGEYEAYVKNDKNKGEYGKGDTKLTLKKFSADTDGDKATATATFKFEGKAGILSVKFDALECKNIVFRKIDGKWYINAESFTVSLSAAVGKAVLGIK